MQSVTLKCQSVTLCRIFPVKYDIVHSSNAKEDIHICQIKKIDEPTQSWSINQRGSTCPYGNCNQYEPLLLVYFRTGQVTG